VTTCGKNKRIVHTEIYVGRIRSNPLDNHFKIDPPTAEPGNFRVLVEGREYVFRVDPDCKIGYETNEDSIATPCLQR